MLTWLEQFAISIILGILQQIIKDPTKKAELQAVLIGIAGDIATEYGYTLTPPTTQLPLFPTPNAAESINANVKVGGTKKRVL